MSSSASPRFVTFIAQHDDATDEFGQPSCITMQMFKQEHPLLAAANGIICFGTTERTDEGIWSPYAKFEVVDAGVAGMVHLKCSYNQKYLRKTDDKLEAFSIEAAANEPEEDTSKWSCTLFRISDNGLQIRYNSRTWGLQAEINGGVFWLRIDDGKPKPNEIKIYTKFDMVDLDMLPTFPSQVCFKADNNKYLQIAPVLKFANFNGNDPRDREAMFRIVPTRLRSVVIVPLAYPDSYLIRSGVDRVEVYVASSDITQWRNAPLEPVRLNFAGPVAFAFRSLVHPNRHFMVRQENGFLADSDTDVGITAESEFLIEDTVRGRQLSNIQFLYDEMKVSNLTPVFVLTKNVVNMSTASSQEAHLAFTYKEYQSNHWETTHSWHESISAGASVKISASIPVIKVGVETTVSVGVETGYQGSHTVGETKEVESEMSTSLTVNVPPKTQSFVHMTVSRAKIRLPYTYTQREVRHDGSSVANNKVDGLYEGEATHVDYQVEESIL